MLNVCHLGMRLIILGLLVLDVVFQGGPWRIVRLLFLLDPPLVEQYSDDRRAVAWIARGYDTVLIQVRNRPASISLGTTSNVTSLGAWLPDMVKLEWTTNAELHVRFPCHLEWLRELRRRSDFGPADRPHPLAVTVHIYDHCRAEQWMIPAATSAGTLRWLVDPAGWFTGLGP